MSETVGRPRVYVAAAVVVLLCGCAVATADNGLAGLGGNNGTRSVDEFLSTLTQMIWSAMTTDPKYSQLADDDDALQSISGRPNGRPPAAADDYFDTGRPPFLVSRPPPGYPADGTAVSGFIGAGGRPPYPPGRPGYRPRPGYQPGRPGYRPGYPQQNSVLDVLTSISQHDDLRCVPRLLCEVSSGARPSSGYYQRPGGYYQQQQQQQQPSSIPFLNKNALITLLTVLNFVDDSPLLMFGRAALLGYNAQGDPKSCVTAYPTCPNDPDQLINYLNNYNGGFFRFFNGKLPQYAPQYAAHLRPPYAPLPPNAQLPPYAQQPPHAQPPPYPQRLPHRLTAAFPQLQYAPQYQQTRQPEQKFDNGSDGDRSSARILSGTPSQYYDVPSALDLPLDVGRPHMTFPSDGGSAAPFAFPGDAGGGHRQSKKVKMTFPDRTGTGGLRAELDEHGNYKGVYYASGAVKFVDDRDVRNGNGPGSRPKFQFPKFV